MERMGVKHSYYTVKKLLGPGIFKFSLALVVPSLSLISQYISDGKMFTNAGMVHDQETSSPTFASKSIDSPTPAATGGA